ncbi:MAG: hypothetical protein M3O71_22800 [Bacteroidota bacterium]|nr:hypothetical protein [Bacteroidota bacterium]
MNLSKNYTRDDILTFIKTKDSVQLANLLIERFRERYIIPFEYKETEYVKNHKNGFAIVACLCLLIESIILYEEGLAKLVGKHEPYYESFFKTQSKFLSELGGIDFYNNIRCGILHQGETLNGWKVRRDSSQFIYDKTINANIFLQRMNALLLNMKDELGKTPIDSVRWKNVITKLQMIN